MRVFMSGATGVIGRRAVSLLLGAGHRVTAAARASERLTALAREGADVIALDLFDRVAVERALAGHDAVINLATHIPSGTLRLLLPGAWRENDRIRTLGSQVLVGAAEAVGVRRFVQESFAPIYPDCRDQFITEEVPPRAVAHTHTVLDAEASAHGFMDAAGGPREAVVLRFALLYGPNDGFTRDIFRLARRGWLPLPGRPGAFLSMLNHGDAATAVVAALGVPSGIYNVADDEPCTRRQFADILAAMLGVPAPKIPPPWLTKFAGPTGELMARSLRISNRKLRAASSWAPQYPNAAAGWAAALGSFALQSAA